MPRQNFIDLTGQTFGRLTVIRRAENTTDGIAKWENRCECGKTTVCRGSRLRSGETKSCGCIHPGTSNSPEYRAWQSMKDRCGNPHNKQFGDYGGRGISVSPLWLNDFTAFYGHIGPKPTLKHTVDRIDNSLGYSPDNVKWSVAKEQNNNKRNNLIITFGGESATLSQWSDTLGMKRSMLYARIVRRGWPIEKAFSEPIQYHRKSSQSQIPASVASDPLA